MSTTITSKPFKHTLSIVIDNQLTVIRTYNYTSNYIGGHGYASDHQMPSGKPSCFFDVFGFILSNLQVNSRCALGQALVRARNYLQIPGPPRQLRVIIIRSPKQLRRAQYVSTTVGTKLLNAVTMSVNYFVRRISLRHGVSQDLKYLNLPYS